MCTDLCKNPLAVAFHVAVLVLLFIILMVLWKKIETLVGVPTISAEANANANSRHDSTFSSTSQDLRRDDYNIEILRRQGIRYT